MSGYNEMDAQAYLAELDEISSVEVPDYSQNRPQVLLFSMIRLENDK